MDNSIVVLLVTIIVLVIGLVRIMTTTDDFRYKAGYRLRVVRTYNTCRLKYSSNYGITWHKVPLEYKKLPYRQKLVYSEKEGELDLIPKFFKLYLNDYYGLINHIRVSKDYLKQQQFEENARTFNMKQKITANDVYNK